GDGVEDGALAGGHGVVGEDGGAVVGDLAQLEQRDVHGKWAGGDAGASWGRGGLEFDEQHAAESGGVAEAIAGEGGGGAEGVVGDAIAWGVLSVGALLAGEDGEDAR